MGGRWRWVLSFVVTSVLVAHVCLTVSGRQGSMHTMHGLNFTVDVPSATSYSGSQWTLVDCEFGSGIDDMLDEFSFDDCEQRESYAGGSGTVYRARCGSREYAWKVGGDFGHSWVHELLTVRTMMFKDAAHTVPNLAICSAKGLRWKGIQGKKVIVMTWLGCLGCFDPEEETEMQNSTDFQTCNNLVEGIDRRIIDETRGKMRQQGAHVAVALAYDRDGDPMKRLVDIDHIVENSDNVVCSGTAQDPQVFFFDFGMAKNWSVANVQDLHEVIVNYDMEPHPGMMCQAIASEVNKTDPNDAGLQALLGVAALRMQAWAAHVAEHKNRGMFRNAKKFGAELPVSTSKFFDMNPLHIPDFGPLSSVLDVWELVDATQVLDDGATPVVLAAHALKTHALRGCS